MKLSWTVINKWASGYQQEAISMMNGNYMEPTEQMLIGRSAHQYAAINKVKFNDEIKEDSIFETVTEDHKDNINRFEWQVNDWFQFVGVVDIFTPSTATIIDLKTGKTPITRVNPMQILVYAVAYKYLFDIDVKRGILMKINNTGDKCLDYKVFKITKKKLDDAYNYLITYASEIYNYINS